ncbi:MAG: leucyl/phenylalanyl-tRNA--protein transferase [Erythrobacter sp.]|uniref:leucyl/phenylalanyl-tRNA--protein transferase n=1 Tax=Erythrobacter sp. TaxID=1042 RepID=UPI0025F7D542|nr:leucyl/phenylalanyl-tRNA--protein transferase [Erythrobacter sp.]MCL9999141.1 leucyl/phenylalanyl-tRNA--protein transferase [Erythrobacter sp.]
MHAPHRPPIPVETLLLAYRSGIFPMADRRDDPEVFWVEPRERAIIPLEGLHLSKSLRKVIRADRFAVTVNRAFEQVIRACAEPRPDHPETWISERIIQSYLGLHRAGHAHSVECWQVGREGWPELVGGLYGVSFERVFCGESMFSRVPDTSKVALAWLVALMRRAGLVLLDCQFMTEHLRSMGACELAQAQYRRLVEKAEGEPRMGLDEAWRQFASGVLYPAAAGAADGAAAGDGAAEGAAEGLAAGPPLGASLGDAGPSSPGKLIVQSLTQTS